METRITKLAKNNFRVEYRKPGWDFKKWKTIDKKFKSSTKANEFCLLKMPGAAIVQEEKN